MRSRIHLKNRIISALLAFAMVSSFIPEGVVLPTQALTYPASKGTLTIETDGTYTATFTLPGEGIIGETQGASLGNYEFILVPDVSNKGKSNAPSYQVNKGLTHLNTTPGGLETNVVKLGAPSAFSKEDGSDRHFTTVSGSVDNDGQVVFQGKISMTMAEAITSLVSGDQPYIDVDGHEILKSDYSLKMVALLVKDNDPPVLASAEGVWEGKNPAVIEISGGPIEAFGPHPTSVNDLQKELKSHPLTLTNIGGEDAVISTAVFGAPKFTAIGGANQWGLWIEKEGTLTPLANAVTNSGDTLTIAPGQSVVVYMQRRQAMSGANVTVLGSGTTMTQQTVNANKGETDNGGTITINYSSSKGGTVTATGLKAATSWKYTTGGSYNNTSLSVTAPQWGTNSNTDSVERSGGDESMTITKAQIVSSSGSNAKVTISGFAESGDIVVDTDGTPVSFSKTATGDLTVKLEPRDTSVASTWNGTLEITYSDTRTVRVALTVIVEATTIDDTITVYKDGDVWDTGTPTIKVRKSGTATDINAVSSASGVYTFNLDPGTYNIYADGEPTGLTMEKEGGTAAKGRVDYYTYTLTAGTGGSVSDGGGLANGVYLKGTAIAPTATKNGGYTFSGWSKGTTAGGASVATAPSSLTAKTELFANFTAIPIKLTDPADVSLTYGSTLGSNVEWKVTDATYSAGDNITYTYILSTGNGANFTDYFTVTPATGTTTSGANTPVTLSAVAGMTPPSGVYTVQITGKSGYNETQDTVTFTITVGAAAKATVRVRLDGGAYTAYNDTAAGNIVTLDGTVPGTYNATTATWTFDNLVPGKKYTVYQGGSAYTGSGTTAKTVTASSGSTGNSADIQYWTVSVGNGSNVGSKWADTNVSSTSGSNTSVIVLDGQDAALHARPATGYDSPASWTGTLPSGTTAPTSGDNITITKVMGTITYTPSYTKYSGTITVNLDGSAYTTFPGSVLVNGATVTAPTGTDKSSWTYSGATETAAVTTSDGTPSPAVSVSGTSRNATVNYYSLTQSVGTGGASAGSVDTTKSGNYLTGKEVTVTATAKAGYQFVNWTNADGTVASTSASYKVTMSKKQELTANFKASEITYNGGSHVYTYNQAASPNKTVTGSTGITGVTFTSYAIKSGTMAPGLTLGADGTITGTPTLAGTYTITVEATASNGMKPTAQWTITVNKVQLEAPVIAKKNDVSVANGSDGAITMTDPSYPADAGVTYSLLKDNIATGTTAPTSWEYTGLKKGTYIVQATLSTEGAKNYEWKSPVSGQATKSNSNSVKLTEPGVNNPTISQSQTYEKNTAITTRAATVTFNFNVGDWHTLSGLEIDGQALNSSDYSVTQPSGGNKTGTVSVAATVLDGMGLTNGTKAVKATFSRTGFETGLTNTATGNLLNVQTTYTVSFDLNGGTAASGGAPSIPNQTISNTTVPTFKWANITNNAPTKAGYAFAGWDTNGTDSSAEWRSNNGNYQPTTNASDATKWNTTVKAVWTANVVTVTTKLNGAAVSGRKITLYQSGTATAFTGTTNASGQVTFSGVTAGKYQIYDELTAGTPKDTGVEVTATAGGDTGAEVRYYDVEYQDVKSSPDHGIYTGIVSPAVPASGNVIINSSIAERRKVTLPGTTADTNYTHSSWTLTPSNGAVGAAPTAAASDWTATQSTSYTTAGSIKLKPVFTKDKSSITVNVTRNGSTVTSSIDVNLTGPSSYNKTNTGITSGTTTFDSLSAGTYTAGVVGWTTSSSSTKSATIPNNYSSDPTINLAYFDYHFNANKPTDATQAVDMKGTTDPAVPVLTGYTVTEPTAPILAGYTFQGWATSAAGPAVGWSTINTITAETTFYAIWQRNNVSLSAGSGHGAKDWGPDKIVDFVTPVGSGTGHTASDFTYTVEEATQPKDGLTVTPGASGFTIKGTPSRVAAAGNEIIFNVKAVSKLTQQAVTNQIKITVEPTFTLKYDWAFPSGTTAADALPTPTETLYVASNAAMATKLGLANSETNTSSNPNLGSYSLRGWSYSTSGSTTNASSAPTNIGFDISDAATAQGKASTGGELTIRAIWGGLTLDLTINENMKAVYHMAADSDGKDKWNAGTHGWIKDGVDLEAAVVNGSGSPRTFTLTDTGSAVRGMKASDFLEIDGHTLRLIPGKRIGNAGTYTFDITVADPGTAAKSVTKHITLVVDKAMPVIENPSIAAGTHYAKDDPLDIFNYDRVHDPYVKADGSEAAAGYVYQLSAATNGATETKGSWTANLNKLAVTASSYNFEYTPADTDNYEKPDVDMPITVVERTIALQVKDDDKDAAWSPSYTNSNTPTYDPKPSWKTVTVKIRNPPASNSPVEKLTWSQTAGASDTTFKDVKVVQSDGTTDRTSPSSLAAGDDGEIILTFQVNIHASGSHTLTFKFDGISGEGKGSQKTASATYTYTTQSQANKLATPVPDLNIVQIDEAPGTTYKKQDGTDVDKEQGGVHLHFPAISQDTGTSNPVKEYVVKISGTGMTTQTIKIPATGSTDGYNYYWEAKLPTDNSGPTPAQKYTVTVQAISNNTALYQHSDEGTDEDNAGYKVLHVANWGQLTDKTFNGRQQNGGSLTSPAGVGAITVRYFEDSTSPAATLPLATTGLDTSKLHVNIDPENDKNEYAVYVTVALGTLYLPITEPTLYPYAGAAAGNDPYWKIKQATATMALGKSSSNGQTMTPADIRPNPTVTYPKGTGSGAAEYNDGTVTGYYDIVYTVTSSPMGSTHAVGNTLTEAQLQNFMADKAGTYNFKASAVYKTGDDENLQFQADVSEAENNFSFTTGNRTVTGIKLERFEAVNGTTGVDKVDTGANLTENRGVTYGDAVDKTDARRGYYDATDRDTSKQMRLDGLRITVTWSGGEPDVYIVGTGTGLPGDAVWTSSNTGVAASPAITDSILTFKGAGVNKNFSTNLTFSYGGKTSNAVTYTMEKRPLDFTVTSDMEKVWNNSAVVTGSHVSHIPDNLTGDNVKVAVFRNIAGNEEYQTTSSKYTAGKTYGPDEGYTVSDNNRVPSTADRNVAKDKEVRAVTVGASGSGGDVIRADDTNTTSIDHLFYKRGKETPGKATIKPARVTKTNVVLTEPSASTVNNENKLSNKRYKPSTDSIEDELKTRSGWSVPVVSIKWEAWDDATGTWVEETDHFSIDTVYRATVVVNADTNHYMSEEEIENYTIRGKKNGAYAIEDLDDWNNREENKVTVTVDQSGPFHPDWAPEEVLYHNKTTFTYVFHTYETPSLQFSDEERSFDSTAPSIGAHHEPSNYVHHTETVTEGASGKTYTITVNAAVKDIFGAQVLMTNKELLDAGATLRVVQGNGTIDVATPVRTDRKVPMYKMSSDEYAADQDLIIYELTIPDSVMAKEGTYHLEFQAMGSTSFDNMDAGKVDVAKSYYTFTLVVREKQQPPVISGGGGEVELPVVTYWLSSYGYTNDLTAEKMTRKGAKPTFVPKITPVTGLRFLGWSETDPSKVTDGKLPTLVDPLTFTINDDKIFYAVYEWIGHSHYVIGFPDGTFGPDNSITRGQVATIIARACLEGFVEGSDYGNPGNYNDVGNHWAASAIAYCSLRGVFAGYEDGTFRPDRYISRQELATVVARLAGVQANQGLTFIDSGEVANWALNGVYTNVANGWVNGYEDNTFRPEQNITRAETVKIFNGYLGRGVNAQGLEGLTEYVHSGVASNNGSGNAENKEYMTWPDVTKAHWAYYEVIEAANDHDYHWIDASKAAPPEKWDAAYIDETWRYYDNENDGGQNVGKEAATFTVTYMIPDAEPVSETVKIYESPTVELLLAVQERIVAPEGFYLVGWSMLDPAVNEITEDDLIKPDPTAHYVEEDRTFYPVFERIPEYVAPMVLVTYVVGVQGTAEGPVTEEVQMHESPVATPKITALEGCEFLGWSRKNPAVEEITQDDLLDPTAAPVTENTTFYAVYTGDPVAALPPVTVTYVIGEQGTTASALTEEVTAGGVPAALPQIQPAEGWQLAGWSETDPAALAEGEEPVLTDPLTTQVTADKTYYAVYRPAQAGEMVTVTYQVLPYEGGSYEPIAQSVAVGTAPAVLPEIPAFEGWELGGWTETDPAALAEGEELVLTDPLTTLVEADKTYYALYRPAQAVEMVTVTYLVSAGNGVQYDPIAVQVARNTAPEAGTLPVAVPDPGFTFAGWSVTDPAGGEISLVEPTATVITEDTTFYAVFRPEQPVQPVEPVVYARTKYINGFEDGQFRPDEGISRAAVAKIIADLLHYDGSEMEGELPFADLENHWARNVITFCIQKGALNGYEDGTFRPDGAITRQEFAVIISRLAGTQSNQGLTFTDVDAIAPWALDGVYTAVINGWINGYEDGTFLPERVMTRAETVKIFNAYLGRSANVEAIEAVSGYTVWTDVPATHWAYYEIVEAANDWEALAQQSSQEEAQSPAEGEEAAQPQETTPAGDAENVPTEGGEPVEGEGSGDAAQPGEGETQPGEPQEGETQPTQPEETTPPQEGQDPALPNGDEDQGNADEGEDAPTEGGDQ